MTDIYQEEENKYIKSLYKNKQFKTYNNYWNNIKNFISRQKELDIWSITYNTECRQAPHCVDNGQLLKLPGKQMKDKFIAKRKYIADKIQDYDAVVELGSGWGRNIFHFITSYDLSNIDVISGEWTESGLETQKLIKARFIDKDVHIYHFDYNNSDLFFKRLKNLKKYNKILFLTYHSIEQITYLKEKFFTNILNSAPNVTCIHCEPIGWQISNKSIMREHTGNRSYYNKNLYSKLKLLEKDKKIKINNIMLDYWQIGSGANCGTLVEWIKCI